MEEMSFESALKQITKGVALLVTATETETSELHKNMTPLNGKQGLIETRKDNSTYYIGLFGNYMVVHVQCLDMGTGSSGGSTITVINAINNVKPKFVLMVGIAFGIDEQKQNIGDVLISKTISPYEIQRVSENKIVLRGSKPEANNNLRDAFNSIKSWSFPLSDEIQAKKELCEILSGEKLVDNIDFRGQLEALFPNAKGGEMEGAGVYAACFDKSIPWILVKAICDFADGQKRDGKAKKQQIAIKSAVSLCLELFKKQHVFEDLGLFIYETAAVVIANGKSTSLSLNELINEGKIAELFARLNKVEMAQVSMYNRFKSEYKAGLEGIKLEDWKERMRTFILDIKE